MLNFDWANGISVETAKGIIIGLFVLMGIAILFLPKNIFMPELKTRTGIII